MASAVMRRLCAEVHLNLAYRWFCDLGIYDRVPDYFPFSKTRHGRLRDSDAFRDLFESVVRRCTGEAVAWFLGHSQDAYLTPECRCLGRF